MRYQYRSERRGWRSRYGTPELVQSIITRTADFINNVMVPDALAIGQFNKPRSQIGTGLSDKCVLSYGAFPDIANDFSDKSLLMLAAR